MIGRRTVLASLAAMPVAAMAAGPAKVGGITRLSPALDRIIAPSASIEILAEGFRWAEGPVWVAQRDYLLFNDPPANILYRWQAGQGTKPFLSPAGLQTAIPAGVREAGLNGLAIDTAGQLIAADSGTRAIVRIDVETTKRTILANRFGSKRFNSPNDLCIAPSGTIYFTDPPYGFADGDASSLREIDHNGLYALTPDGDVALVDGSHRRPNGVALSPDGRTLYLALSDEKQPEIRAYTLDTKGRPTGQRLFHDMRKQRAEGLPGLPDGIKVAPDGHVFATGPGGVHIVTPDGTLLGIVATGKAVANCCFGPNGKSLFMTSSDRLAVVALL
ncbi:SMP-30/gluconolactonase/LRE family protein [Sphingobium sp. AR-3-1]|uniref:SMP-30/gluconolactonase/LRE family protein n=1 Tax=Sphingobium psychrophilum TaxID=2728834 RepID=A0A7X9WST0_9SPHN|nr:SMP-30/gluconolactonase/LRE family protein [Sphingobium psychrophilum]NML09255.1 SMP-30/gluconolactonase/LRE family protein [Sphingobium psychrophilum]